jgi:hypothetical protein
MSCTYSFGAPNLGWPGSAIGPTGLGARNVSFSCQKSCHRVSISPAMAAV